MSIRSLYIYIIGILSLLSLSTAGQTAQFFSSDDCLTNSLTTCLMQDSRGFLWAGTRYGLTRYDGYRFRHFTHRADDSLSLGENNVICMAEQQGSGAVLIGTSGQLTMYDYSSQAFRRVPVLGAEGDVLASYYVTDLLSLADGSVLGSTVGFGIFRIEAGQMVARMVKDVNFSGFADVIRMTADNRGEWWMMTENWGVCRVAVVDGKYRMKKYMEQEHLSLTDICTLADGRVVVGTVGQGVYVYDAATDGFQHVPASGNMNVLSLCATRDNRLLVGTNGNGMYTLLPSALTGNDVSGASPLAYTPQSYWRSPVPTLGEQKISAMTEDRDGNLWLALFQKGLLMQPRLQSGFVTIGSRSSLVNPIGSHCVMSVMTDRDGRLWVGTDHDGIRSLTKEGLARQVHIPENKFTVMHIAPASDGKLWLATYLDGCLHYDPQTGHYTRLACTATGNALHVMAVQTDSAGRLWIATNGDGLICYSPQTGQSVNYKYDPMHLDRTNIVSNNWVNCLSLSHDKRHLFVGMSNGMMTMDLSTGLFDEYLGQRVSLVGSAVHAVREDRKGRVWVATSTGLYNMTDGETVKGLSATDVASVEIADDGTLWASTIHGLCHYDPVTDKAQNYFVESGLQGNEYSNGASCKMPDGRMVFGGQGGISLFHPKDVNGRKDTLHISLTGITLDGHEVTSTTRSGWQRVCDGTVMDCRHFSFAADDNSLTLSFSTMDFALANGIQYIYRLGTDDWRQLPQGTADLTLNQLSPGTYPIEVKALSGLAESDVLSFDIVVRPPLYATWWACVFYLLAVLFVVWRIFANRKQREQARLRMQEYVHAADLREQRMQHLQQLLDSQVTQHVIGSLEKQETKIESSSDELLLAKVIEVVKQHLDDSEFSVEFLAGEVGLSRSQLHRRMKAITGQAVSDFIRGMRLKHAAQLLESGHQNMTKVAYACGFETPSSFSTAFKRFYGVVPSEFVKK